MKHAMWKILLSLALIVAIVGSAMAAVLNFDRNADGKTTVWDLQQVQDTDQAAALEEALCGKDELHKNADGHWEIWTKLGLYHMAELAQSGDTFVLMQDIDLEGDYWRPVENFKGKLMGNSNTVSNMRVTADVGGNMGFFANIAEDGYVECLNIKDMNLIASDDTVNIGLLAGTCAGTIDGSTTIGFVTDYRTTLPADVNIGGMAGKMLSGGEIISRDANKLPSGTATDIFTISSKLGTNFATLTSADYKRIVGIVGELGEGSVDSGTLLEDLSGKMVDPNAIAWVTNGDVTTYPHTLDEILAGIHSDGNTQVILKADISHTSQIRLPYSCTIDCNGYAIRTPVDKANGLNILEAGSENKTFTLENGTLTHYEIGVRVSAGAVVLNGMTIVSYGGAPVGLYDSDDYSAINKIENCTLVSEKWGVITYNVANADMSKNGITIENSNLIAAQPSGYAVFIKKASQAGTVTFGNNVNLYTYGESVSNGVPLAGIDPAKLEGTADVTVLGKTYSGLSQWTTDESVLATEVIAEVTNGTQTIQVTNVTDMIKNIAADGTTKIKLVKDITRTSQISIPYSCEIDLNNCSITSTNSNALTLDGVGTANTTTTIKNGRLNHAILGVRVNTGAVHLDNVEIFGVGNSGASVAYYDPDGAYREDNHIENCYFYNPYSSCIQYSVADVDFHETGVSINDTTLIAKRTNPFGVVTDRMSGIVDLGPGVEIYSGKNSVNGSSLYRFLGLVAYRTDKTSVNVDGTELTGLCHWSTDNQKDIVDILLIGNSYSTTIPQELYNIATNAGYEVNVANIYYPGCVASQHWDWLQNDVANYQYRHQSQMGNYIRRGDMSTSKYALEDEDWDVIVYQDWFPPTYKAYPAANASTLEELYANHQEPAYNMMQYLKTNYPDAQHYYYQHWAWQLGHSTIPDEETRDAMWERVNTASTKFAEDNDFILIPCGLAFEMARLDASIGDAVYDTDKFHDGAAGGGQYLNGCVFFETIFRESCIGDTWRASNGPSEEIHQRLQQIAHQTVIDVHGADYVTK